MNGALENVMPAFKNITWYVEEKLLFFHFSTGAILASLPRHFQSDFTLSGDTFEGDHTHWIALWRHAPQKGAKFGELFLRKRKTFARNF